MEVLLLNKVKIRAYKYPNIPHYEWGAYLLQSNENYVLLYGASNRKFVHHTKKFTTYMDNPEIVYFPLNDWYTVCVQKSEKNVMSYSYYCNICEPPRFVNDTISFVDYDIDLLNDGTGWRLDDVDELLLNNEMYGYPHGNQF